MSWSTRELAELAGTSLRAVRHYHEVGLLEEPLRSANGYKNYDATHLIKLLKIRRLTDLGFSLPQIAKMEDSPDQPGELLRSLDAQLAQSIDRLQRARLELSVLLDGPGPLADLPAELAPLADQPISDADRAYLVVLSRVVSADVLQSYLQAARAAYVDPSFAAFNELPASAGVEARVALVDQMLPSARAMRLAQPVLNDLTCGTHLGRRQVEQAMAAAVSLYNTAQRDVLERLEARLDDADDLQ